MSARLDRLAGSNAVDSRMAAPARLWMARQSESGRTVHVYWLAHRIPFAQIYPFLHYRETFAREHGVSLRFLPVEPLLAGEPPLSGASQILFQCWFDVDTDALRRTLDRLRATNPEASIDFIDSFATNDLRLARHLVDYLRFYLKKSLFRDRMRHADVWRGDTNLIDYAANLLDLPTELVDFRVPPEILPKLRLSPNFFTAPQLFRAFRDAAPPQGPRTVDIHARMRVAGGSREHLRTLAFERLSKVSGNILLSEKKLPWSAYMKEMKSAKLCFSPFGYGEICWRDIEAILAGAVMIKPDMSHLDTLPDLYEPDETYLPCAWDFSDLEDVVARALGDTDLCRHIAATAWERVHRYVTEDRFVRDMAFLWA